VRAAPRFGAVVAEPDLSRVFPSIKFRFHLRTPAAAVRIRAPARSPPRGARPRAIETPALAPRAAARRPKTARFGIAPIDPELSAPMRPFADARAPPPPPPLAEIAPALAGDAATAALLARARAPRPRWTDAFALRDETDALTYVAAVNPETDFLQFHFGTLDRARPYAFRVTNRLRRQPEFHVMRRRGVLAAHPGGDSEFVPLFQYVVSKTQFQMLRPIQLFSHFRVYKAFNYWHMRMIRSVFLGRLDNFCVDCWASNPPFPPVIAAFRSQLLALRRLQLVPQRRPGGEIEFSTRELKLTDLREDVFQGITAASSEVRVILNSLAVKLNEHLTFITSPKVTDYLEMKKIPCELFMAAKVPFKKSLSLVEAKEMQKRHEFLVGQAKADVCTLRPFLNMCDKMVSMFFLQLITTQFRRFVSIFSDPTHEVRLRTLLTYDNENLVFVPSYHDLVMVFQEHFNQLFDFIRSFIRPIFIDPNGSGKLIEEEFTGKTLNEIIKADPDFSKNYDLLQHLIDVSYKGARNAQEFPTVGDGDF
jgi:hypothetical protein